MKPPHGLTRRHLLTGGVAVIAGCGAPEATPSRPQTVVLPGRTQPAASVEVPRAAAPRDSTAPWVIGASFSITGAMAQLGKEVLEGIQLAITQANASGGVLGRAVEVRHEEAAVVAEVARAMRTLRANDDITAFIGDLTSGQSLAAGKEANRVRVPMITPSATHPDVTLTGPFMFRMTAIDPAQGVAAAVLCTDVLKRRKIGLVYVGDDLYSSSLATAFKVTIARTGARIVLEQKHPRDATFPDLVAFKKAGVDAIFAPLYHDKVPLLMQRATAENLPRDLFVGGDGWSSAEVWKEIEGAHYLEHFMPDMPWKGTKPFVDAFAAQHGRAPGTLAALGHDAALAILDAMKRAEDGTPPGVRDALAATRDLVGAAGRISFDRARNPTRSMVAVRVQSGKPVSRAMVGYAQLAHD
jgi:branched-chain amino acid transport system substrate-binding protein